MGHEMTKSNNVCGFTLIEVTVAIGLVSFGLLGLLGLLPVGLQTFRSAVDTSVRSQIAQRVISDAMETDFDTLIGTTPADRYFDGQGLEVAQPLSVYEAHVQITGSTALPAGGSSLATNANLATVEIQIADNPAHLANPYSGNSTAPIFTTTTFIARNTPLPQQQ
ncbi:MAG TPA: Verru_Chthon cassette protein B [Chthoniobacteraceae bacterium]|jgi:uncharacterized protein (TIGR02598 family)|nr:Verru_Chthon cassette protein B [Chthoniobacteraceae bacterium]